MNPEEGVERSSIFKGLDIEIRGVIFPPEEKIQVSEPDHEYKIEDPRKGKTGKPGKFSPVETDKK